MFAAGHGARFTLAGIAVAAAAGAVSAQGSDAGGMAMLNAAEAGRWELRDVRQNEILHASVCVGNPVLLTQPQHGTAACSHTVISSSPRQLTVQYSCPGTGSGRTTLRLETPRLLRVQSQGMFRGAPFNFDAQARRVASCG